MSEVFTPWNADQSERLSFPRNEVTVLDGDLNVRALGYLATVSIREQMYKVYGISCGLEGCNCDAYIE